MSHEVMEYDKPAYSKKPAWHGLGVVIPEGDLWKLDAEHVLGTSGMDYEVEKVPTYRRWVDENGDEHFFKVPTFYMTVRMDLEPTNPVAYLGQVGEQYNEIQNSDLRDFAAALSAEEELVFETAGTLRNGKMAWMLAKRPQALKVMDDKLIDYLLLSTSHDGTQAFIAALTRIRVVCWNTLSAAINAECTPRYVVRHTEGANWKIAEAKAALQQTTRYGDEMTNWLTSFAKQAVDKRFVDGFLQAMIPGEKWRKNKSGKSTLSQAEKKRNRIRELVWGDQLGFDADAVFDRKKAQPTAYGLFNAFTQWGETDRVIRCRTQADGEKRDEAEARMDSVLFGSFARDREVAFQAIGRGIGLTGEQPIWEKAEALMAGSWN